MSQVSPLRNSNCEQGIEDAKQSSSTLKLYDPSVPKPDLNFRWKRKKPEEMFSNTHPSPAIVTKLATEKQIQKIAESKLEQVLPMVHKWKEIREKLPLTPLLPSPSVKPLEWIKTYASLQSLLAVLKNEKELAIDIEQHSHRSYDGITCLVQIGTRTNVYLLDTLIPEVWDNLNILQPIFADPNILKVFQHMEGDIKGLSRDFDIYVVNAFDTNVAATVLGMKKTSLCYLVHILFGSDLESQVSKKKQLQLEDWRRRPLTMEMEKYAYDDVANLLDVYDFLLVRLLVGDHEFKDQADDTPTEGEKNEEKEQESMTLGTDGKGIMAEDPLSNASSETVPSSSLVDSSPVKPKVNVVMSSEEMMMKVIRLSQTSCLSVWNRKKVAHKRTPEFNSHASSWTPRQKHVFKELFFLRDRLAKYRDESPTYISRTHVLYALAARLPTTLEEIEETIAEKKHQFIESEYKQILDTILSSKDHPSTPTRPPTTPPRSSPKSPAKAVAQVQKLKMSTTPSTLPSATPSTTPVGSNLWDQVFVEKSLSWAQFVGALVCVVIITHSVTRKSS